MIGRTLLIAGFFVFVMQGEARAARDAAFLSPSSSSFSAGQEEIKIEPKSDVDLGETSANVARRTTFFFVNVSGTPIDIVDVTANGDSNVLAAVVDDDCTKQGKIAVNSRCSISVETTPSGSGQWTAELLLMHKGAGRLARARITGRTLAGAVDRRESGLSLSSKDIKPVDFGDVEVGTDKAVRTALMINDSNEPITILSVEVIAAENGMEKLEQGCAPDIDLKPGESCPVTMIWKPENKGIVSTDLIIRHSGRQGFAVIPVRGNAKETVHKDGTTSGGAAAVNKGRSSGGGASKIPLSPTADELEKMIAGNVTPISADALAPPAGAFGTVGGSGGLGSGTGPVGLGHSSSGVHLIGTVGNRGVFYMDADGSSVIASMGEDIFVGGQVAKVVNVMSKQAELHIDGKKKTLNLETVGALTARASIKDSTLSSSPLVQGASKSAPASVPVSVGK